MATSARKSPPKPYKNLKQDHQDNYQQLNNTPSPPQQNTYSGNIPISKIDDISLNKSDLIYDFDSDAEIYAENDDNAYIEDEQELNISDNNKKSIKSNLKSSSISRTKDIHDLERERKRKLRRYWFQLLLYIIYNSIRFLIIGIIIFIINYRHQNEINKFPHKYNCCYCYQYAQLCSPTKRIDWSMCYDDCGCNKCNINAYNHTNKLCGVNPKYSDLYGYNVSENVFDSDSNICGPNLYYNDGYKTCPSKLSITTYYFFRKDYKIYGYFALISVILYSLTMVSSALMSFGRYLIRSSVLLVFCNLVVSFICSFCVTKPYQYKLMEYYYNGISFKCYKDGISEPVEDTLSVMQNIAFAFLAMPFFLCCMRCICVKWKDSYRARKIYSWTMRIVLIIAVVGGIIYVVVIAFISLHVSKWHYHDYESHLIEPSIVVVVIDTCLAISVFDLCICCEFCRDKISVIYMSRYAPNYNDPEWRLRSKNETTGSVNSVLLGGDIDKYIEYQ